MINRIKKLIWAEHSWMGASELCELAMALPNLDEDNHLAYAIATGVVTSYARPFTKCEGFGALGKEFREFKGNERLLANHERLLECRDKIFAHKDEKWEINSIGDRKIYELKLEDSGRFQTSMSGSVIESFDLMLELIDFQKGRVLKAKEQLLQAAVRDGLKPGDYRIEETFKPMTQPDGGINSEAAAS